MIIGIFPGTFDPMTNGHTDILIRATKLVDVLVIGVANNVLKKKMFDLSIRQEMVHNYIEKYKLQNVKVKTFAGLLVDFAKEEKANFIIRGLRAVSDFEYEFQMAQMNRHLEDKIETIFMMPNEEYFFTSSRLVKQVFKFTSRERNLIPANVHTALCGKFGHEA